MATERRYDGPGRFDEGARYMNNVELGINRVTGMVCGHVW